MDYKYIEELLESYWRGATTLEEEEILRLFFRGEDVPDHLLRYRPLFAWHEEARKQKPGADFDERLLAMIDGKEAEETVSDRSVKATVRRGLRLDVRPFCRAAAVVAVVLTIGGAVQSQFGKEDALPETTYDYSNYHDTYSDPQAAYDEVSTLLRDIVPAFGKSAASDSLQAEAEKSVAE